MRDLIADAGVPPIDRDLMAGAFSRELAELLGQLGDRERLIVERRFGLGGGEPRTLRELGAEFRISNERVRQIEAQALERLRRSRRTQRLRGYLN
jgi:RNA polymerase primary sigma factor